MGLWVANVITIWSIFFFPLNRSYTDSGHFDFLADFIINSASFILLVGTALVIIIRWLRKNENQKTPTQSKLARFLSFVIYGILSAYYGYLFLTNFWYTYRLAWQAYITVLVGAILTIISCFLYQKFASKNRVINWLKDLYIFIYSFVSSLILILVVSLIFPLAARQQTKKIVQ